MVLQEYQIPEGRSTTPSKPNVGIVEKTNHTAPFSTQQPKNVFEIEGNLDHVVHFMKREIRKTDCYNYNCYNTIFGFKTTKQIVVSFFISSTFPVVLKFSRSKHSIFEQDKNKERITSINTFFHHILSFHFPKVSYITQFLPLINFFFSLSFSSALQFIQRLQCHISLPNNLPTKTM